MAHVIYSLNVCINGSCDPVDTIANEEHHDYAINLLSDSAALLLGRNTFEMFEGFWPSAPEDESLPSHTKQLAIEINKIRKLVASNRAISTDWNNVTKDPIQGVAALDDALKIIPGNVCSFGSPTLASTMLEGGLIDEIHILYQPIIRDSPISSFPNLKSRIDLKFLEAIPFSSGVLLLRYET